MRKKNELKQEFLITTKLVQERSFITIQEQIRVIRNNLMWAANNNLRKTVARLFIEKEEEYMLTIPSSECSWFFGNSFMLNKLAMINNKFDISEYNKLLLNKVALVEDRLILKKDNSETNKSPDFIL